MKIKNLKLSPRPHYLTEGTKLGNHFFQGKVLFPLSDPTLLDRKDHANTAHLLFCAWNIAHLFFHQLGIKRALATGKLVAEVLYMIPLETELDVRATYVYNKRKRTGVFEVWFFDAEEKQLAYVNTPFRTF